MEKKVIFYWLRHLYTDLFGSAEYNRITLLGTSSSEPHVIRPFVRYDPQSASVDETRKSRAYFGRGEGCAGKAWENPHSYVVAILPPFEDRMQLTEWYTRVLEIPEGKTANISSYLDNVRTIFCYGFINRKGVCDCVLSIDSPAVIAEAFFAEKFVMNKALEYTEVLLNALSES